MRILFVEDDESIVEVVSAILNEQNYIVDIATDGEAGWELVEAFPYDLVLLDIGLPKLDGITFCRRLRHQKQQVLVMLLTAQDTTTDKLLGLDAGADDYVVKPFDAQELAARIRALLRRGSSVTTPVLTCGNLCLDPGSCEVTYSGKLLRFSRKEYLLLELFLRHQHRVFSRSAIVDQIWSFSEEPPNEDTVKSHIKSIRRKLSAAGANDLIETLYGQGYRINPAYLKEASALPEPSLPQPTLEPAALPEPSLPQPTLELAASSGSSQPTLELSVAKIWQKTKGISLQRVNFLDDVGQALQTGKLDPDLYQKAIENAHKLTGSLGTFGFEAGSRLAQQLEHLLQSSHSPRDPSSQQQMAPQVQQWVAALRTMLDEPAVPEPLAQPLSAVQHPASSLLLILDTDRAWVQGIAAQASAQNLRVAAALTVQVAQQQCQQERPHLALMDIALLRADPHASALLAELQKPPVVPVILLSTEAGAKERVEAVHLGGQLFLKKSLAPAEVLQTVVPLLCAAESAYRVLVVDDDPAIANALTLHLQPLGIQLVSVADPAQLWDVLNVVEPHLLILDINMPNINGLELCRTVRHDPDWRWLPIVFLTAQTDAPTQKQVFAIGADDLITKPFEPKDLSTRILNRLRRGQSVQGYSDRAPAN